MNYNTLSPTEKIIKKTQNFATGQFMTSGEVYNIAIIDCSTSVNALVDNVASGVKSKGGVPSVHKLSPYGLLNNVNPASAKYADSVMMLMPSNAQAIIKVNAIDAVVVVSDCDISVAGVLSGCLKSNCPVLVLPLGINEAFDVDSLRLNGKLLQESFDIDKKLGEVSNFTGLSYDMGTVTSFFRAIEAIGLTLKNASTNSYVGSRQMALAFDTGKKIVEFAKDLNTPKHLLTKDAFVKATTKVFADGGCVGGLISLSGLIVQNGNKIHHDFFADVARKVDNYPLVLVRGSACEDGGYAFAKKKLVFSGRAWVYNNLEDADKSLASGAITEGVIVLQNCVGQNVSSIIYTIEGMGKETEIAVVTDGLAEPSEVLTVVKCTPHGGANGDFANIQTGDVLDIDLAKGRFNTSVSSKDMKGREKRNSIKEQIRYFG